MLNQVKQDFNLLSEYLGNSIRMSFKRLTKKITFLKSIFHKEEDTLMDILLDLNGAKKVGGEFLGKRFIQELPVLIYKIKRVSPDRRANYFYVGYILKDERNWQFVMDETWENFINNVSISAKTGQKVLIGLKIKEGGKVYDHSKGRYGRKVF